MNNSLNLNTSNIEGTISGNVVDYTLISNKPKINDVPLTGNKSLEDLGIEIPTKVSDLQNDSGYITSYTETDPVFSASVASGITAEDITKWNNQSGGTSDYTDLTNKPSINNITLNGNKSLNDLGIQPSGSYALTSDIPTKTSDLTNDSGFTTFSGNYNDLTNKPTIPTVPTNVSAFTNDAGYLTSHQDISGKLDTSKVKSTTSTTSGDVYDVTYINTMLGDIESLLGGI